MTHLVLGRAARANDGLPSHMSVVDLLLGLVAGTVASVAAWWLLLMYFTPRFEVSALNRLPKPTDVEPCGYRYRIKVRNLQRRYGIGDLSLHVRLVIRGLDEERPTAHTAFAIPVGDVMPFPYLDGRKHRDRVGDSERVYVVRVHDLVDSPPHRLPEGVRAALNTRTQQLEGLFGLGTGAFVRIAVTASHARSGFRRTISLKARPGRTTEGEFVEDSVEVR